ncbi:MAG: tyrosine recombinase [Planctomycetota bacterium]|nr:tyrosine recombinase [Planctomycetota bacterium]
MGLTGPVADFLDAMRVEAGLSRNALRAYGTDLKALSERLAGEGLRDWQQLTEDDVYEWLADRRRQGAAEATIARGLVSLRMLVRFLVQEGGLRSDPTARVSAPRLSRLLPTTLTPEQVDSLLQAFAPDDAEPMTWRQARDSALLEVLYAAGARISEALGLTTEDLPPGYASVRLHGKGDKMRIVPLGKRARAALELWIEVHRPILLKASAGGGRSQTAIFLSRTCRPLDRPNAWRRVKDAARLAGLPSGISPHDLRHSFASHMLAGGADLRAVQEMLGHASIRTTEIYTHLDEDHVRAIHRMHHPRG